MADIILIATYIGDFDVIRDKPHLPLPLIQAAALTSRHYRVSILDLRLLPAWHSPLRQAMQTKPFLIGFSVMSGYPVLHALEVSQFIKDRYEVPIVWGGHHPTLSPVETLTNPAVDMVVIGDGEASLLELSDRLCAGKSLHGLEGVWFKEKNKIIKNPLRSPLSLNDLPLPPYDLVKVDDYMQNFRGRRMINIETSRGCTCHCRYCYHTANTGRYRFRTMGVEQSMERILWARDQCKADGVYLVDDNFFVDKTRGMQIAKLLHQERQEFNWVLQGVDIPSMLSFNHQELQILEKSGLLRISSGADSGSPRILRYIRKPHTTQMITKANLKWRHHCIYIYYSWLSGFPGESIADLKATIAMIFKILEDNPHARTSPIYNFLPFPGTPLWEETINQYGFEPPVHLSQWGRYDFHHVNVNYLDPALQRILNNLHIPSLCIDRKFDDYGLPVWLHLGVKLYRPLAKLRLKTLFDRFPFEKLISGLIEKKLAIKTKPIWTL